MRKLIVATLFVLGVLFVPVMGIASFRTQSTHVTLSPPAGLRNGDLLPLEYSCYITPYHFVSCSATLPGGYYLSADVPSRRITHIAQVIYDQHVSIGELINQMGQPLGHRRSGQLDIVSWAGWYVYLVGKTFAPDNIVSVIVWDDDKDRKAWKGFINKESR